MLAAGINTITAWVPQLHTGKVWMAAGLAIQGFLGGKAVQKAELFERR